jgi:hypothetical protein
MRFWHKWRFTGAAAAILVKQMRKRALCRQIRLSGLSQEHHREMWYKLNSGQFLSSYDPDTSGNQLVDNIGRYLLQ